MSSDFKMPAIWQIVALSMISCGSAGNYKQSYDEFAASLDKRGDEIATQYKTIYGWDAFFGTSEKTFFDFDPRYSYEIDDALARHRVVVLPCHLTDIRRAGDNYIAEFEASYIREDEDAFLYLTCTEEQKASLPNCDEKNRWGELIVVAEIFGWKRPRFRTYVDQQEVDEANHQFTEGEIDIIATSTYILEGRLIQSECLVSGKND